MPDYYLIPKEEQEPRDSGSYDDRQYIYNKPVPCNLLLPSIHASRPDNVLLVENDDQEAVDALITSCSDAESWPSYTYSKNVSPNVTDCNSMERDQPVQGHLFDWDGSLGENLQMGEVQEQFVGSIFKKQKTSTLDYDTTPPHVIQAARSLFFERRRQQSMYGGGPSWARMPHHMPSDYELFAAWACLSKAEKTKYIAEVTGDFSQGCIPSNYLESQRAVMFLYSSCPDSQSWPSFQFSREQSHINPSFLSGAKNYI